MGRAMHGGPPPCRDRGPRHPGRMSERASWWARAPPEGAPPAYRVGDGSQLCAITSRGG
ncbi:hypothetical protein SHJG_7044 [Streptomyces hygroscopicus subsp. jinggangensis 5008]|nr:hypothetical protein SHJG_7044 [Streptomyces hygroscopicus subsp. jinggangensis 5008]AGF66466.1 hypothetical protein SHJGH_6804 [Streptomyces hygroscopicus subsp. jinggangensis TL01]